MAEESMNAKQIKFALEEKWNEEQEHPNGKGDETMTDETLQEQKVQEEQHTNEDDVQAHNANEQQTSRPDTGGDFEELAKTVRERDDYLEHLKRLQAEFDNFRKRTQREKEDMRSYLLQNFLEQLLPVVDSFGRALETANQSQDLDSYRQGVEMVYSQLTGILKENGLEKIESVGQPFDPNLHEAVAQVETEEQEPGHIVTEFSPGYKLKDRVIQAPKVQVAIAPAQQEDKKSEEDSEE